MRISPGIIRLTHLHIELIRGDHEALEEKHGGPVTKETVTFHFAKSQPTLTSASLSRLPGQERSWASSTSMNL